MPLTRLPLMAALPCANYRVWLRSRPGLDPMAGYVDVPGLDDVAAVTAARAALQLQFPERASADWLVRRVQQRTRKACSR